MRTLLSAVLLVAIAAVALFNFLPDRAQDEATSQAAGTTTSQGLASGSPPVASIPAVAVSRTAAIEFGRMRAASFGEADPALIDALVTTLSDARRRLASPDGTVKGSYKAGWGPDHLVWLVRMRGTFKPPHPPRPVPPTEGWMYTVVDATTGQTIQSGFAPSTWPLR